MFGFCVEKNTGKEVFLIIKVDVLVLRYFCFNKLFTLQNLEMRLLRHFVPRNDVVGCHCEQSEAISVVLPINFC